MASFVADGGYARRDRYRDDSIFFSLNIDEIAKATRLRDGFEQPHHELWARMLRLWQRRSAFLTSDHLKSCRQTKVIERIEAPALAKP